VGRYLTAVNGSKRFLNSRFIIVAEPINAAVPLLDFGDALHQLILSRLGPGRDQLQQRLELLVHRTNIAIVSWRRTSLTDPSASARCGGCGRRLPRCDRCRSAGPRRSPPPPDAAAT